MNNKEEIRKKLESRKEKLENILSKIADKNVDLEDDWKARFPEFGHEGSEDALEDAAKEREEYERNRSVEQTLELKLEKIKKAIQRIKRGEYGVCLECEGKIDDERLSIVPEAELCAKCKK